MSAVLLFLALAIGGLGVWEMLRSTALVGERPNLKVSISSLESLWPTSLRRVKEVARALGLSRRISRAGLAERLTPSSLLSVKVGSLVFLGLAPLPVLGLSTGGRLEAFVFFCLPLAAFFLPDALLEILAAKRMRAIGAALPDWLDLASIRASSGSSPVSALSGAAPRSGPLRGEVGIVAAETECGIPAGDSLRGLSSRVPLQALVAACVTVERSRTLGSPLAAQLRDQAGRLRAAERRRIVEQGARAAPKIQLVVALLLVPSVLLMIAAGLLANIEDLVSGF